MREGEWKLIVPHAHKKTAPWGDYLTEIALYHLPTDPEEKTNLATREPDRVKTLQTTLDAWWKP